MALEPIAGQTRDLVERSRLFEEMGCSGHDNELLFAMHVRKRFAV